MALELEQTITDFTAAEAALGTPRRTEVSGSCSLPPMGRVGYLPKYQYRPSSSMVRILEEKFPEARTKFGVTPKVIYWGERDSSLGRSFDLYPEQYLPYLLQDETLTERRQIWWPTTPVNQYPYLYYESYGAFMVHACTFAHHIIANHRPDGVLLEDRELFNFEPSQRHTDDAALRNRIALRVGRCTLGYIYDKFKAFENLDSDPPANTPTQRLWRDQLDAMRELDAYICEECGGNHFWLRDFIRSMDASAWDTALDEILIGSRGSATNRVTFKYIRLPKISKVSASSWVPSTESLASTTGNDLALASGSYWKTLTQFFGQAVTRWDRDPKVRETSRHELVPYNEDA